MSANAFNWRSYPLRLKVLQPAFRLWHGERPTWYVVTRDPPVQIWRITEHQPPYAGASTTFMRRAPDLATGQLLAEEHWTREIQRGLHDDEFPLAPEPSVDLRPRPFWSRKTVDSEMLI